jgi:hypothetical protein
VIWKPQEEFSQRFVCRSVSRFCFQHAFVEQQIRDETLIGFLFLEFLECLFERGRIAKLEAADCPIEKRVLAFVIGQTC